MDVGNGAIISDKWIPVGVSTGLHYKNGVEVKTADKVKLNGCGAKYAFVGRDSRGVLMLFMGRDDGVSIGWELDQELIDEKDVRLY